MPTSEEQHASDEEKKLGHNKVGGSAGGSCLNRHVASVPSKGANNSCSHRWQSYMQMKGDKRLYNWPKYKSLSEQTSRVSTAAIKKDGVIFPDWYKYSLKQPKKGDWNVKGKNFFHQCYIPYWHEAHHIVPNSTLRNSIAKVGASFVDTVRQGLLKEKYNVNEKKNMIMLPLDKPIARALKLPVHRKTASHRNHSAYSNNVASKTNKIMLSIREKLDDHEKPNYKTLKNKIEKISTGLYPKIKKSSSPSLDDMKKSKF